MADVRNGYGFAGSYRNEGVKPIAPERGLPDDFRYDPETDTHYCSDHEGGWPSDAPWNYCERCTDLGDHSQTWLTLRELLDYEWDATVVQRLVVPWIHYVEWKERDKDGWPREWCQGASGPLVVELTEEAAEGGQSGELVPAGSDVYVIVLKTVTCKEVASTLYDEVLPWLGSLGEPEHVRIVMGFDS